MNKKAKIFLLLILGGTWIVFKINHNPQIPISTSEAYHLGISYVREKYPSAQVQMLTSVDNPDDHNFDKGSDGKKRFWNFDIAIPDTEKHILLSIKDKKISNYLEIESVVNNSELISLNLEKQIISSTEIVSEVIKKYNLKPSKNWAYGYQFVLEVRESTPTLSIVATDSSSNMARIYIDAINKNVLSATHKIISGGGIYKNNDMINIPNYDNNSVLGISQTADNLDKDNLLVWGWFDDTLESKIPKAFISKDEGFSWSEIKIMDTPISMWFSPDDFSKIFMVTNTSLYVTNDYGNEWTSMINDSYNSIIESTHFNKNISIVSDNKLLISRDNGNTWIKDDLDIQFNNVMLTNDHVFLLSNNLILQKKVENWESIFDITDKEIIGVKTLNNYLVIFSKNKLYKYSTQSSTWQEIDLQKEIENIFFKNNDIYLYCNNGELYKLIEDTNSLKIVLKDNTNGYLTNLIITDTNNYYYVKSGVESWDIMEE